MTRLSDQLSDLGDRIKEAQDTVAAAEERNHVRLTVKREALKTSVAADMAARAHATETKRDPDDRWDPAHAVVSQRFAAIRARAAQRRAEGDIKTADHIAAIAEQDASDAIDLAVYVLVEAEWAIVDAVIARADADGLVASP